MTREEQKLQAAIAAAMNLPKEVESDAPIFPTSPVNQAAPEQPVAQPQSAPQAAAAPQQQAVQQQPVQQPTPVQQQAASAQPVVSDPTTAPEAVVAEAGEGNPEEERDWDAVEEELNASIDKRGKKRKAKSVTVNVIAYAAMIAAAAYGFMWYNGSEENKAKVAGLFNDVKSVKDDLNPKKIVDSYKDALGEIEEHQKKIQGAGAFLAEGDLVPEESEATAQLKEQMMQLKQEEAASAEQGPAIQVMPVSR